MRIASTKDRLWSATLETWGSFSRHPVILACVFLSTEVCHQLFLHFDRLLLQQHSSDSAWILANELGALVTSSIFEGVLFLLIPTLIALHDREEFQPSAVSIKSFLLPKVGAVCIELIRATARVIRWGLLFLIPGLYKHLQYFLVPLVVMFEKPYEEGKVDALDRSSELLRGQFLAFFLFIALATLFEYAAFSQYAETSLIEETVQWLFLGPTKFLFEVFFYSYLYLHFRYLLSRRGSGHDIE